VDAIETNAAFQRIDPTGGFSQEFGEIDADVKELEPWRMNPANTSARRYPFPELREYASRTVFRSDLCLSLRAIHG
jgi:hypothetical protein